MTILYKYSNAYPYNLRTRTHSKNEDLKGWYKTESEALTAKYAREEAYRIERGEVEPHAKANLKSAERMLKGALRDIKHYTEVEVASDGEAADDTGLETWVTLSIGVKRNFLHTFDLKVEI